MFFYYLSGSLAYGLFFIAYMMRDPEADNTDPVSWRVIAIACAFWPIVIPISYLELREKKKKQAALDAMPKPVTIHGQTRYIKTVQTVEVTATKDSPPQLQPES